MKPKSIIELLSLHEGVRLKVYDDANGNEIKAGDTLVGHPTIGVGRNIAGDGLGITKEESNFLLINDVHRVRKETENWGFFERLNEVRQAVILDMLFNMGLTRFNPGKWPKFFEAIEEENWKEVSVQMLDSSWSRQVKSRSNTLSELMISGKW